MEERAHGRRADDVNKGAERRAGRGGRINAERRRLHGRTDDRSAGRRTRPLGIRRRVAGQKGVPSPRGPSSTNRETTPTPVARPTSDDETAVCGGGCSDGGGVVRPNQTRPAPIKRSGLY